MHVPADVPRHKKSCYTDNLNAVTFGSGNRLLLFAADQKIEHLHGDFYGPHISTDAADPRHLFAIAASGHAGAFATHLGLIARYGTHYPQINNYIVKLNGKTNLLPSTTDPISRELWRVDDVVSFKEIAGLPIRGIGYTIYLGSVHEPIMLEQAAQAVWQAHQHGLIAILWIYLRGQAISNDTDPHLLAGAAGLANALGADFVKIKAHEHATDLAMVQQAAGNTGVICSGGPKIAEQALVARIRAQLDHGGIAGAAVGRNIFQLSLPAAIALLKELHALVYRA